MNYKVSLKHLVNRMKIDQKMLKERVASSKEKETIEKHMEQTRNLIVECVMKNADNVLLERILM